MLTKRYLNFRSNKYMKSSAAEKRSHRELKAKDKFLKAKSVLWDYIQPVNFNGATKRKICQSARHDSGAEK